METKDTWSKLSSNHDSIFFKLLYLKVLACGHHRSVLHLDTRIRKDSTPLALGCINPIHVSELFCLWFQVLLEHSCFGNERTCKRQCIKRSICLEPRKFDWEKEERSIGVTECASQNCTSTYQTKRLPSCVNECAPNIV